MLDWMAPLSLLGYVVAVRRSAHCAVLLVSECKVVRYGGVFPRRHSSFRLISLLLFSREGENLRPGDDEDGCRRLSLWRKRDRLAGALGWGCRRAQKQKGQHSESAAAWDFVRGTGWTGSFSAQLQGPLS